MSVKDVSLDDIDVDLDFESKTAEELREIAFDITKFAQYKLTGDGRIGSNETKERIKIQYCNVVLNAVELQLEDIRQTQTKEALNGCKNTVECDKSLYVVSGGDKCKIGISENVQQRVKQLQAHSPKEISVDSYSLVANAGDVEEYLHSKYSEYNTHGEWFDLPPDEKKELVETVKNMGVNQDPEGNL